VNFTQLRLRTDNMLPSTVASVSFLSAILGLEIIGNSLAAVLTVRAPESSESLVNNAFFNELVHQGSGEIHSRILGHWNRLAYSHWRSLAECCKATINFLGAVIMFSLYFWLYFEVPDSSCGAGYNTRLREEGAPLNRSFWFSSLKVSIKLLASALLHNHFSTP